MRSSPIEVAAAPADAPHPRSVLGIGLSGPPCSCQLLLAGVRYWSVRSEGLQPELSEAFLADALVVHVPLDRVVGYAADRGELVDHQADRRFMGSVHSPVY